MTLDSSGCSTATGGVALGGLDRTDGVDWPDEDADAAIEGGADVAVLGNIITEGLTVTPADAGLKARRSK